MKFIVNIVTRIMYYTGQLTMTKRLMADRPSLSWERTHHDY